MFEEPQKDQGIQANLPVVDDDEKTLKIRPLERIRIHPKDPPEPSTYGKYSNFSRSWILQDGREVPLKGSVTRDSYQPPRKLFHPEGTRRKLLKDFFWEQMLDEMIEELATKPPVTEYCTEYDAHYVKEDFEPRNLAYTADKVMHLKYPLYGTGSSAMTFYKETVKKTGPQEILEPFRRCQEFTRPMEERLDDGWVL